MEEIKIATESCIKYFDVNSMNDDKKMKKITSFSRIIRFSICKYIYEIINQESPSSDSYIIEKVTEDLINLNSSWIRDIPKPKLILIKDKLENSSINTLYIEYIRDLLYIVREIVDLNKKYSIQHKSVDIREAAKRLYQKRFNLGLTELSFEVILREIFDYLKENINDFKLKRIKQKKLVYDKVQRLRECSRCQRIMSFNEFSYIKGKLKNRLRYICRSCRTEIRLIKDLRKKVYLLNRLNHICPYHNNNLIQILPAVTFHHKTSKKSFTWSEGREKAIKKEEIYRRLKEDNVIALCENSHRLKEATIFHRYKDLILQKDLFTKSTKDILNLIEEIIENVKPSQKSYTRRDIKRFIRKRYVFEKLFDGKCVGCCEVNVFSNLPALTIHHSEIIENPSRWRDIADLDSEEIIDLFLKEKVIGLCANCHRISHSSFYLYIEEILQSISFGDIKNIKIIANDNYKNIVNRIKNYKIDIKFINFTSPLKKFKFTSKDAWKYHLIQFYYSSKKLKVLSFRREDFKQICHINPRTITKWIKKLLDMKFLEIEKPITSQYLYYYLTPSALEVIKRIEKENKLEAKREKDLISSYQVKQIIRPLRYRVFMKYFKNQELPIGEFIRKFFPKETEKSIRNYYYVAKKWFNKKK